MAAIFMIVFGAGLVFLLLALLIRKPAGSSEPKAAVARRPCAICQEEFPDSELVLRTLGEASYKRYFCDRCVTELYEESRLLHDPLSKVSEP